MAQLPRLNRATVSAAPKGATGTTAEGPAVSLRGVAKRFGATRALEAIDLDLFAGEVHALVGENGAGKSTCLGVMAGRLPASEGQVEISGQPLHPASPLVARKLGVAAIYQELTTFPDMNALDNAFIGAMPSRLGLVNRVKARRALRDLLDRYDLAIDPTARAGDLSIAALQIVEILRGVYTGARVLLFDEPTASLGTVEREALHKIILDLKAQGTALAFVSHDLDEVLELSDRITVFRDGHIVAARPTVEWDKAELIKFMLGRSLVQAEMVGTPDPRQMSLPPRLKVQDLAVPGLISGISFDLRPNEVLGVSGLVGSGRTTLLRALAGMYHRSSGELTVDGTRRPIPRKPAQGARRGVVLLPEDRRHEGLFMDLSARENIVIASLRTHSRFGWISRTRVRQVASALASSTDFQLGRLRHPARTLSGGNQQKLLFARALDRNPTVLLCDEPTRGIDIGTKTKILTQIRDLAENSIPSLLVSSDVEEICMVADRVLVLHEGQMVGVIDRASGDLNPKRILEMSFNVQEQV